MNNGKTSKKYYALALMWLTVAVIVALFIIHFTGEEASVSNRTSKGALYKLLEFFGIDPTEKVLQVYNHYIRKAAHFTLFFAFGFSLCASAQYQSKVPKLPVALIIGGLFAIGDEVRQHFIPGRAPGFKDVIIDFSGVLFGALAVTGLFRLIRHLRSKRAKKRDAAESVKGASGDAPSKENDTREKIANK